MGIIADLHNDLEKGAVQLIAEYRTRLYGDAVRLCGDKPLAEDLVFRTFEKVLDKIDTYKTDKNLYGWMKSIMENLYRDDLKRPVVRNTDLVGDDEQVLCTGEDWSTDEQILRNSDSEAIREAINSLDEKYRQAILMRYYDEMSIKEIASFLCKPMGTVSRRVQIAHRLLAGKLKAEFGKAKKPLALLGTMLIGIGTLFGAYQAGIVEAVKSYFTSEEPASVAKTAAVSSAPTAAPANVKPETTTSETNEKRNNEMNLTKTVKTAALSAAVMFGAGSASGAYTSASYVHNEDMIAQWDAIDNAVDANGNRCHVESPATWRELVSDATVTHTGSLMYNDTSVKFDGTAYLQANIPAVKTALANKSFTVQLCVNVDDYVEYSGLLHIGSSASCRELLINQCPNGTKSFKGAFTAIQYATSGWTGSCVAEYDTVALFKQDILITVTVDESGAHTYLDDIATPIHTTTSSGLSMSSDLVSIGVFVGYQRAKFSLCSARFYDRVLTPEEIAANNRIDGIRFRGESVPEADFVVAATPQEHNTDPATIRYGVNEVAAGDVLSAPNLSFNNGIYVCTGYRLYNYTDGAYVLAEERADNSYTVKAGDVGTGRKLVWQWEVQYRFTPASYAAQDALAACWDGVFNSTNAAGELGHDASATGWRDTKRGLSFTFFGSPEVGDDYIGFDGNQNNYGKALSSYEGFSSAFFAGEKTVEVVTRSASTGNSIALMGSTTSQIAFGPYNNNSIILRDNGSSYLFPQAVTTTFIGTYATTYDMNVTVMDIALDGEMLTRPSDQNGWINFDDDAWLGRRSTGTPYNGKIYAIRIYNRRLTANEIACNAAVDAIRFKGADPDEAFAAIGIHLGENDEYEYLISVDADGLGTVSLNGGAAGATASDYFSAGEKVTVTLTPAAESGLSYGLVGCDGATTGPTGRTFTFFVTGPNSGISVRARPLHYVDAANENPVEPYDTPATAATTIRAAYDYLTNAIAAGTISEAEIRVAKGTYPETDFLLDQPITVVGETGDPKDVEIVDQISNKRAFTMTHAQATVKNLTISGTGYCSSSDSAAKAGHIYLTAGLVENCIIKDGVARDNDYESGCGGNVYMTGGRLSHCQILNGRAKRCEQRGQSGCGGGVFATGGVIENCLVAKNGKEFTRLYGDGIWAEGTAQIVNCTVIDNVTDNIYVNGANVKIVNCIFFGCGEKDVSGIKTGFSHCAASVENASCDSWLVIQNGDFAGYLAGDYHLGAATLMLDYGTQDPVLVPQVELDLDGFARVSGTSIDLGCYEFDQSSVSVGGYALTYGAFESSNVVFHASAKGGSGVGFKYKWDFGDGTVRETELTDYTYAYPTSGLYRIRVTAREKGSDEWAPWFETTEKLVIAPTTMYVDTACATPTYPYKTKATAAHSFADVFGALTNNVSGGRPALDGVTIIVCNGRHAVTDATLDGAFVVRGETGDPKDVEIVDQISNKRAFTMTHAQAAVKNLTISGTGYCSSSDSAAKAGHIYLTAGLVENCIIKDGVARDNDYESGCGGNVYMTGGRLSHCQILNGRAKRCEQRGQSGCGGGVFATGGVIENCLVAKNGKEFTQLYGDGIWAEGTAQIVNCTVIDNVTDNIYVNGANVKIVNSIFFGCGEKDVSGIKTCFSHCAASVENASCDSWRVIDETAFWHYDKREKDLKYLRPSMNGGLHNTGTTWAEYLATGAASELDLLNHPRLIGKHLDLGAFEGAPSGGVLTVR